ncbi:MAG: DUF58 domain-containing protein [Burkholderiales bacterium]|nr:DUF58 domain-containing protein [Burkholderiales bacterium]
MPASPAALASISARIARLGAPAFRRVYRYDRALRRKLTPAGWLLAALAVLAAVFGLNTREVMVYQLFGLAVGLFAVAAVAGWRLRLDLSVARRLPQWATAGVPFDYTLTLRHRGAAVRAPLWVEDLLASPPAGRPGLASEAGNATKAAKASEASGFAAYKVSADRTRNLFDRFVGYPRFVAYMRWRIGARVDAVALDRLAGERQVTMRCLPLRRGVLQFEAVRVARAEPLGLLKAHVRCELPETLLVLPRTWPVAALALPGSRRLQPGGVAFAGRIGEAEEFVGLRDYRAGDTPRRIHWKAWARLGRPVVKEYQDEFFVRHALVLDSFGEAAGSSEVFETAVALAASLVVTPRSNDSLLDLMFVEGRAYTFTQGRGLGAAAELLRVLAALSPTPGGSFEPLAEAVALGAARISGAICVLLAWDEPRQRMVAGLRARGLPVRVWVVGEARADGAALPSLPLGPMASDPAGLRTVNALNLAQELLRP